MELRLAAYIAETIAALNDGSSLRRTSQGWSWEGPDDPPRLIPDEEALIELAGWLANYVAALKGWGARC